MIRFINIAPFCLAWSVIPALSHQNFVSQAIAGVQLTANNFSDAFTIDLDGDTDIEFLSASAENHKVKRYENAGTVGIDKERKDFETIDDQICK